MSGPRPVQVSDNGHYETLTFNYTDYDEDHFIYPKRK